MSKRSFGWSTVITSSLVIGFVGFGLGFNYDYIENKFLSSATEQNQQLPDNLNYASVEEIYDELRQNFDGELNAQELLEGAKRGLVRASGDPFTEYLDQAAATEFQHSLEGTFSGIGAQIAIKNNRLVVVAPLDSTPADKAGLQPGDHIAAVDGEDTSQMTLEEAVSKIRGEEGTDVKLLIVRDQRTTEEVTITRGQIEVPSVTTEVRGNVGIIELNRFGPDTAADFDRELKSLKSSGIEKIVLDMRNNPGGLLTAAISVADEFLGSGNIVEVRRSGDVIDVESSRPGGLFTEGKVVVLINVGSASASEIVAGALADNGRAQVVGEQSFGKGSVQELQQLKASGLLKVTTSHWFTPNGTSISEEGITPDIKVELTNEDFNNDRDPQLDKALELLR